MVTSADALDNTSNFHKNNLIHDPHLKLGIPTSSSSLLVPPKLLTITARRSPLEFKLSAVADAGLVMWVKIDFTASLVVGCWFERGWW